jgi:hypothetical protein
MQKMTPEHRRLTEHLIDLDGAPTITVSRNDEGVIVERDDRTIYIPFAAVPAVIEAIRELVAEAGGTEPEAALPSQVETAPDDGRPCTTEEFLDAAVGRLNNEGVGTAMRCWYHGQWDDALAYFRPSVADGLRGKTGAGE